MVVVVMLKREADRAESSRPTLLRSICVRACHSLSFRHCASPGLILALGCDTRLKGNLSDDDLQFPGV
jgi:hypothetical protein